MVRELSNASLINQSATDIGPDQKAPRVSAVYVLTTDGGGEFTFRHRSGRKLHSPPVISHTHRLFDEEHFHNDITKNHKFDGDHGTVDAGISSDGDSGSSSDESASN